LAYFNYDKHDERPADFSPLREEKSNEKSISKKKKGGSEFSSSESDDDHNNQQINSKSESIDQNEGKPQKSLQQNDTKMAS